MQFLREQQDVVKSSDEFEVAALRCTVACRWQFNVSDIRNIFSRSKTLNHRPGPACCSALECNAGIFKLVQFFDHLLTCVASCLDPGD